MMKKSRKDKCFDLIVYIVLALVGVVVVVPFLIMVFGSFKTSLEAARLDLSLPEQWIFENYATVVEEGKMVRAFFNSVLIVVLSVGGTLLCAAPCGFVLSRRQQRASRNIYKYIFIGQVAPYQIVTTFILFKFLHISGYPAVILLYIAINIPFSTMIYEGFVKNIPAELDEAAALDGAGPIVLFLKVILPLMKPVSMTCIITTAIGVWNDFMLPLYMLSSTSQWTLPLTVYNFYGRYSSDWNLVFACLIISCLPMIIVYLCLQKYIVAGMTAGAVKG